MTIREATVRGLPDGLWIRHLWLWRSSIARSKVNSTGTSFPNSDGALQSQHRHAGGPGSGLLRWLSIPPEQPHSPQLSRCPSPCSTSKGYHPPSGGHRSGLVGTASMPRHRTRPGSPPNRSKAGFASSSRRRDRSAQNKRSPKRHLRVRQGGDLTKYLFIRTETVWRSSSLIDFRPRRFPVFGISGIFPCAPRCKSTREAITN